MDLYSLLLIVLLGHPRFMVREGATRCLTERGTVCTPALLQHVADLDAERAHRCLALLEKQDYDAWCLFTLLNGPPDPWIDSLPKDYADDRGNQEWHIGYWRDRVPHPRENCKPVYEVDTQAGKLFILHLYYNQGPDRAGKVLRQMRARMLLWNGSTYDGAESIPTPEVQHGP